MGTNLSDETQGILAGLDVEHFIIAYDADKAGQTAIQRIAKQLSSSVYYLGGLKEGDDPADKLKQITSTISSFSLQYLMASAKKHQPQTDKPINISIITTGMVRAEQREVLFQPAAAKEKEPLPLPESVRYRYYNTDDFLPLLGYNHTNKASLEASLHAIAKLIDNPPAQDKLTDRTFKIKSSFVSNEFYEDLGPALILWLYIAIEQQRRKRFVRLSDSDLADQLHTSRKTVSRYKAMLKELGFLNIVTSSNKVQKLSVSLSPSQHK